MKRFDLHSASLDGLNLVEAGAGTGKTYTIAGLFVRLIVEKQLEVDQVLVVTYTKAATEELKTRIRNRLMQTQKHVAQGDPEDPLAASLTRSEGDAAVVLERIRTALLNFDRAAIFTIHGFCQRLLKNFAFETGSLFQSELVQDQTPFVQEAIDDFWRRYISNAPFELALYLLDTMKNPEQLAAFFSRCRYPGIRVLPEEKKPLLRAIKPWREYARHVRRAWPDARAQVVEQLQSPGLNARYYGKCDPGPRQADKTPRQYRVDGLAAAMDNWQGTFPLFDQFDRFTAGFLENATRKKHTTPDHPFFSLCGQALKAHDAMAAQLAAYRQYLEVKLLNRVWMRLSEKKTRHNVLFFDDLLLAVYQAMTHAQASKTIRSLQRQYRAALVDEFQDTDPLQYEIFHRLFGSGPAVLFMIGDPKQAIYSFRGADVFSYLQAAESVASRYTLTRNWRSSPGLVQAVNAIFGRHVRPFGLEKITYQNATAARSGDNDAAAPMVLWYLLKSDKDVVSPPYSQQEAVPAIALATAGEIVKILEDTAQKTAPEQIAVLTRSHYQARIVKQALVERGVPAVLHSAGSVFETPEASQLVVLLKAVAEPANPYRVRAALAGDLLGAEAHDFLPEKTSGPSVWEARWGQFADYHQEWLHNGFYGMFSRVLYQEKIKERLLSRQEGERHLTNLLHLAELLHQASIDHKLGPEALVKWLQTQQLAPSGGEEAQQLRLESDDHAVRILTIHKSKGLQFEYVFCPFTWAGAKVDAAAAQFHDPAAGHRLTVAVGPDIDKNHRRCALEEELAENLRLLYVALTRARRKCYWVWGRFNKTELSAPAYLLHASHCVQSGEDWTGSLKKIMAGLTDAQFLQDLEALAGRAKDAIDVGPLPRDRTVRLRAAVQKPCAQTNRQFTRHLDAAWRMSSFSALTSGMHPLDSAETDTPDRDAARMVVSLEQSQPQTSETDTICLATFPKGTQSGLFFHDVLEHFDFQNPKKAADSGLVTEKLKTYGIETRWEGIVTSVLYALVQNKLSAGDKTFALQQVPAVDRIPELDFHFPLKNITVGAMQSIFKKHANTSVLNLETAMERLAFEPVEGFIKGFIDLVFRRQGRYYLVDWKSNHLGDNYADYAPDRLAKVMVDDFYFLQYHLYVVALDQWLRRHVNAYDYSRHFGGVFYIFLRGLGKPGDDISTAQEPGNDSKTGVFFDLPDQRLVCDLRRLMLDEQNGGQHARV